jgi:hypothetical protein
MTHAGRVMAVLAGVAVAGLGSVASSAAAVSPPVAGPGNAAPSAAAVSQPVAWGTTSSAPAGAFGELFGVAAASADDVLAVGGDNPGQPPTAVLTTPYAEHWNGSQWSATSVPLGQVYPPGEQAAQLNGVTEPAPGDGWAVGTVSDPSLLASRTLAYHWDGTAWTRSPTPNPAGLTQPNQLNAVAGRTANDVWAAGDQGYPDASLVLHWNGSSWTSVRVPDIGSLDAVTVAPGSVWIAGGERVEQFNGTAWTPLPVPPAPPSVITGLAHTAAGLWAVGYVDYSCGEGGTCTAPWAALWNGTAWTQVPAGGGTGLTGVAAVGSRVLATGDPEVTRLTLTGAHTQVTPQFDGQLTAIAADPTAKAWAAGWAYGADGKIKPAIINAPGIGQGGIVVSTGAAGATVTWAGPVTGAGGTGPAGGFAVGGLPDGSYTVTASLPGCQPGVATAQVSAGVATAVKARITCPPG